MRAHLIKHWWPTQCSQNEVKAKPIVPQPILEMFSWVNDMPKLPDSLERKFADDNNFAEAWSQCVADATESIERMIAEQDAAPRDVCPDFDGSDITIPTVVLEEVPHDPEKVC